MQRRVIVLLGLAFVFFMFQSADAGVKAAGKIYFVDSPTTGVSFLASINPDGTAKTRLTPAFYNIHSPKYSVKKNWIGFTNKTQKMESEIYLMEKKRVKRIITGATLEDFSPNGDSLLYITADQKAELFVYNITRKRAVKISQDLKVVSACYSPNGEWIITSVMENDGTTDLYLISTLAQGIIRLTKTQGANESFPIYANDNKTILYITDRYGDYEMEYMEVEKPEIFRPSILGLYPSMSPDNEWIVYESQSRLMTASKTGYDPSFLTLGKTPIWVPSK